MTFPGDLDDRKRADSGSRKRFRGLYRQLQYAVDLTVLAAAFLLAYLLRFDFRLPPEHLQSFTIQLPFVVLLQFAALFVLGVPRRVWRYTSLGDLPVFLAAAGSTTAIILAVRLAPVALLQPLSVPRTIIVMDAVLGFGGLVGARVLRRWIHEASTRRARFDETSGTSEKVILVGAGRAGVLTLREIRDRQDLGIEPLAFVDDDPLKQGSVISGVSVAGTTDDLPELVDRLAPDHVILTISNIDAYDRQRILDVCEGIPADVRTIPGYDEILQGSVSITRFREVEPTRLLDRDPVHLASTELTRFLRGRTVMITGAGGSIGSELTRQVAACEPESLILVDRAEFALFQIEQELVQRWPGLDRLALVADAGDAGEMGAVVAARRPTLIVHAAAHKHVPLMESNVTEAIRNNVFATEALGRVAGESGVERFILVSTDKAVRPRSVMGASKRIAELVVHDLDARHETRYSAARFGNVLGSTGSVVPIFAEQIRRGGPVTVTHPEMRRYFMAIPEAAQLVLVAGALSEGGEIMVLDMGDPVRIYDVAEKMIRLSGFEPHVEIAIEITGPRPGEKLAEELLDDDGELERTRHPKILAERPARRPPDELARGLERLRALTDAADGRAIRAFLNEFITGAAVAQDPAPEGRARDVHGA